MDKKERDKRLAEIAKKAKEFARRNGKEFETAMRRDKAEKR